MMRLSRACAAKHILFGATFPGKLPIQTNL
jgi:hypothetical protein